MRRASEVIDVPGTPRSLRLDNAEAAAGGVRLRWSFADPEVLPGDREPHGRRIHGVLEVRLSQDVQDDVARGWWAEAQLAAARRYRQQIDADWSPGEPYVRRIWTIEEAWQALLTHLGRYGAEVHVGDGEIRVVRGTEQTVYRIDPAAWAGYLTEPEVTEAAADSDIVPVATPLVDGLPLWAVDELFEAAGAWGPVVGLVDGRLVGLQVRDD
ncbi:hypothetical protein [Nocardioides mesophilus]|uniref:Uncharacterized protein n=1 Tax=Nocardioides mesophilus TaxID=433659 RepID=A0A7G9R6S4_9ACTN|nr:hypothetical protein [Nocardioides mesophilus]QNN51299.1 hypothetical protein H9L09_11740 [Nocardioides mesophilus]